MSDAPTVDQQLTQVLRQFEARFGRPATHAAVAPGRVNLIGEHTDYNDGFVMPMAIERQTVVVAAVNPDKTARLASTQLQGVAEFPVDIDPANGITNAPIGMGDPSWSRYLRGVLAFSYTPQGFDLLLDSNVPAGGGLSSSASIEVATATLIEDMFGLTFNPVNKALLCQMAEHRYGGAPCGIMDQFISVMGQKDHALLIDCRSFETAAAPLTDESVQVMIANSKCPHELSGNEYSERRSQCETAANVLGVTKLRDAKPEDLEAHKGEMDELVYRRAKHVIDENLRTLDALAALRTGDWATVGKLMFASHASLRDDFEVSTPELDTLVSIAEGWQDKGVIGSRMTGGGFGGCTVTLVKADAAEAFAQALSEGYQAKTGIEPAIFTTRPADGARALKV